jgi:hypothetical protein
MNNVEGAHAGKLSQYLFARRSPQDRALTAYQFVAAMDNLAAHLHAADDASRCVLQRV